MKLCYRGVSYQPKSVDFPVSEPETKGIYRSYPFGYSWSIATHIEDIPLEEAQKRLHQQYAT